MERMVSWGLGVLAYLAPPIWAHFEKASVYSKYKSQYGYVSGTSLLTVDILAWIGAVLLSALALGFAWLSFRKLPKPRPRGRIVELTILALPPFLPAIFIGLLYVWFYVLA